MKILRTAAFSAALLSGAFFHNSCSEENEIHTGTIGLQLTDAPIDASNVSGVYITITGVEYRREGGGWQPFEGFAGPNTLNLLDFTEGKTALLGDFEVEAGKYTGLRFKLDAAENGGATKAESATYLEFEGGERQPLFVPSGTKSGYKAYGDFMVPVNGSVFITADFDVRKSVIEAGSSGKYLLKPHIRLVVNEQAGSIEGNISGIEEASDYIVFAYTAGSYSEAEAEEPLEGESRFANAVSSTRVNDDGSFLLAFLAPGEYELVVAKYQEGAFQALALEENLTITVASKETGRVELDVAF